MNGILQKASILAKHNNKNAFEEGNTAASRFLQSSRKLNLLWTGENFSLSGVLVEFVSGLAEGATTHRGIAAVTRTLSSLGCEMNTFSKSICIVPKVVSKNKAIVQINDIQALIEKTFIFYPYFFSLLQ